MSESPAVPHPRWTRVEASADFFLDEDRLRLVFWLIVVSAVTLLAALAAGLWRLRAAALTPPRVVGISHGLIFSAPPQGVDAVGPADFDQQMADTIEVLFSRTEKGLPPEVNDFCAPEAVAAVEQSYRDAGARYPAGYVQTLSLLEARSVESGPGSRRVHYRGLLSTRSVAAAATSPIYLDCTFAIRAATPLNVTGWRLVRVDALSRDAYYRDERERRTRAALGLPRR